MSAQPFVQGERVYVDSAGHGTVARVTDAGLYVMLDNDAREALVTLDRVERVGSSPATPKARARERASRELTVREWYVCRDCGNYGAALPVGDPCRACGSRKVTGCSTGVKAQAIADAVRVFKREGVPLP